MAKAKSFQWKDPGALTAWVVGVMIFDALWSAGGLAADLAWGQRTAYADLGDGDWGLPQLAGWLHDALTLVSLPLLITALFWLLRVSKNAHVLKGRKLNNSPMFTALWWYVIPFMSLFKPVESLGEVWDVSAPDASTRKSGRLALPIWWGATLIGNICGTIAFRLDEVPEAKGAGMTLHMVDYTVSVIQCVAFILIATRIAAMQKQKRVVAEFSDAEPGGGILAGLTA